MGPGHDISFGIGHSGGPPPFGLDDEMVRWTREILRRFF
jgi:hypothetical protein